MPPHEAMVSPTRRDCAAFSYGLGLRQARRRSAISGMPGLRFAHLCVPVDERRLAEFAVEDEIRPMPTNRLSGELTAALGRAKWSGQRRALGRQQLRTFFGDQHIVLEANAELSAYVDPGLIAEHHVRL